MLDSRLNGSQIIEIHLRRRFAFNSNNLTYSVDITITYI